MNSEAYFSVSSNFLIVSEDITHSHTYFPQRSSCSSCIRATYIQCDPSQIIFTPDRLVAKEFYINFMLFLKPSILISSPHTERKSDSFTIHQKIISISRLSLLHFQIVRPFHNDIPSMSLDLRFCRMILGIVIDVDES